MEDSKRFRLLGKYRTPRFRVGQRVRCLVRGEMVIPGVSDFGKNRVGLDPNCTALRVDGQRSPQS
jgi:hypothetical protein